MNNTQTSIPTNSASPTAAKPAAPEVAIEKPAVAKTTPAKSATAKTASAKTASAKATPAKKVLAKVPVKATIKTANPKATKTSDKAKVVKPKSDKVKMERDSFTMPKEEYAQLAALKSRMVRLGKPVKKSELLRAGIKLLTGLSDPNLQSLMASIPAIKTGRPKKK